MSALSKMNNESAKLRTYRGIKTTTYDAPTPGLEHIMFKQGKQMKPGSFKTSHCSPNMKTKLRGMLKWKDIKDSQDGILLVKMLHQIYFDQDGSKQSMWEIVTPDKKLYLYFQKKDWSLDKYTREFNARKEVCKEIGSTPGKCLESA